MSFATLQTARQLTAPGYFDFSGNQSAYTGKIFNWINSGMQVWINQTNLMDSFFRLWLTYDYSVTTVSRTPYVQQKLNQWGLGWFQGSDQQGARLVSLVSRGYSRIASENFQFLFLELSKAPFIWCEPVVQLVYGSQYPAVLSETLIIYTDTNFGVPPDPQAYIPRAWTAPTGYSQSSTGSVYFSRGYLDSGNIIWMMPQPVSVVYPYYNVAEISDLPASPDLGSIAGVADDGTGDVGAIYYYDGSQWRKTTTPNADQGLVGPVITDPIPRVVVSPNPDTSELPITSLLQPPVDGPSQGYGMYGGLAQILLESNQISVTVILTEAGFNNLGVIVNLLRRIKPLLNKLSFFYTLQGSPNDIFQINILDARAI